MATDKFKGVERPLKGTTPVPSPSPHFNPQIHTEDKKGTDRSEEDELASTPLVPPHFNPGKKTRGTSRVTIKAISGKKVTLTGGEYGEEGEDVYINGRAKVTLNDKEVTLAALDNGDMVHITQGEKNDRTGAYEYHHIEATRDVSK